MSSRGTVALASVIRASPPFYQHVAQTFQLLVKFIFSKFIKPNAVCCTPALGHTPIVHGLVPCLPQSHGERG